MEKIGPSEKVQESTRMEVQKRRRASKEVELQTAQTITTTIENKTVLVQGQQCLSVSKQLRRVQSTSRR